MRRGTLELVAIAISYAPTKGSVPNTSRPEPLPPRREIRYPIRECSSRTRAQPEDLEVVAAQCARSCGSDQSQRPPPSRNVQQPAREGSSGTSAGRARETRGTRSDGRDQSQRPPTGGTLQYLA